jgi:hypothetical protein
MLQTRLSPPHLTYTVGPGSFLSICSKSGIEWVSEKTGVTAFAQMARKLTFDICRRLKLEPGLSHKREPEPKQEVAWQYVRAYFEDNPDAVFGIICRPSFEARLRAHFKQGAISTADHDPAWYALRNIVYATGCRSLLSKQHSGGFHATQSWQFFQNALTVHTELLYSRTGLMAVQALAAMVAPPSDPWFKMLF